MGHSRGGEAAALAATFNRLKYYPDNFKQEFKFNFDIKAVVAIAPVDGQYKPTGQFTPLENVNYLLIHGSHDGDVSTAHGPAPVRAPAVHRRPAVVQVGHLHVPRESRPVEHRLGQQGQRPAQRPLARSARADRSRSAARSSRRSSSPASSRRRSTASANTCRCSATIAPPARGCRRRCTRRGFRRAGYRALAEFDDDVDLTTGIRARRDASPASICRRGTRTPCRSAAAAPTRRITTPCGSAGTTGWRRRTTRPRTEAGRQLPNRRQEAGSRARRRACKGKLGPPATYSVSVPDALRSDWGVGERSVVYLSLAATNTKPGPRTPPKDPKKEEEEKAADEEAGGQEARRSRRPTPKEPPKPKEEAGRDAGRPHASSSWTRPATPRGCRSAGSASRASRSTRASIAARAATRSDSRTSTS